MASTPNPHWNATDLHHLDFEVVPPAGCRSIKLPGTITGTPAASTEGDHNIKLASIGIGIGISPDAANASSTHNE
jgi:hypothetical protein